MYATVPCMAQPQPPPSAPARTRTPGFGVGLARAVGGAIIFSLPLLMTMEMWELGFHMSRLRLALLLVVTVPLLVGLSHFSGFEETFEPLEDVVDAFVAYAVGFVAGAVVLALFGVLRPGMSLDELVGKVALQAVPGSMGALLAQSQFGGGDRAGHREQRGERTTQERQDQRESGGRPSGYASQLFLMAVGALFLAFNVAPTEEMALIAHMMTPWHVAAMAALSLAAMHAFVYALEFRGQHAIDPGHSTGGVFLRYTVVGYALALLISAYVLWTFGSLGATDRIEATAIVLVLGFPAAIGAAAARLIL
jgi:putative integral membrane protein (TIGR02587 family)